MRLTNLSSFAPFTDAAQEPLGSRDDTITDNRHLRREHDNNGGHGHDDEMEALLREAGEGLGRGGLGENDNTCRSVGELKSRIAALFSGKVSETHAEHVSASFDVPADVVLNLGEATSMQQNDGSLDGTGASSDPEVTAVRGGAILGGVVRNFVTVREVVMSQPETNPLLQRAVAAFLIIQVRQADGSMWAAQEPTRATQGWTVAYACQNSMACWHHAHKRQRVVGLSALEDMQDPLSLGKYR